MGVLNVAIKIENCTKSNAIESILFELMCEYMGSHYYYILQHAELRSSSSGSAFTGRIELRTEIAAFLMDQNAQLLNDVDDTLFKLSYFPDKINNMNEINLSLH